MLHCNMTISPSSNLRLELDDVLGDLRYARRTGDLGRLALLTYCEVRRWARMARADELAQHASDLVARHPHPSRDAFLALVDQMIDELELIRSRTDLDAH
jgi:hypothetical protein